MTLKSKRNENGAGTFRMANGKLFYRITYIDEFGEKKRKGFAGATEAECLDRAEAFLCKIEKKIAGCDEDATMIEILRDKYDNDYAKNYVGEQGYSRNLGTLKNLESSPLGKLPIAEVTAGQINLYLQSIVHYSDNTIKKLYRQVNLAYKIALEQGIVSKNLLTSRNLRRPKSSKKTKKVYGFTVEEQSQFVRALEEYKVPYGRNSYKLQLLIELYSGMRMGEINALRPENIDFDKGVIHVKSTISRGLEYRIFIKDGAKTRNGVRDVPINKMLKPVLEKALAKMEEKPNPLGLVFFDNNKNDVIDTSQVNSFFYRLLEKAGISKRGQHALRHTFATRCIEANVPAVVLKNWLGHKDIHITLDTYADVFANMHNDAMEKLEEHVENLLK